MSAMKTYQNVFLDELILRSNGVVKNKNVRVWSTEPAEQPSLVMVNISSTTKWFLY